MTPAPEKLLALAPHHPGRHLARGRGGGPRHVRSRRAGAGRRRRARRRGRVGHPALLPDLLLLRELTLANPTDSGLEVEFGSERLLIPVRGGVHGVERAKRG